MKKVDKNLVMKGYGESHSLQKDMEEPRYPVFHYEGPEALDIPETGTMVINYRQTRVVSEKRPKGDWYQCDVEVRKILSAEPIKEEQPPAKADTSAAEALDKLMAERESENE